LHSIRPSVCLSRAYDLGYCKSESRIETSNLWRHDHGHAQVTAKFEVKKLKVKLTGNESVKIVLRISQTDRQTNITK